jgi:hypothetical protein
VPRITYRSAQKREAVALAVLIGAELAGQELGIDPRTVRIWTQAAGKSPADVIEAPSWERLGALAMARAERLVASG